MIWPFKDAKKATVTDRATGVVLWEGLPAQVDVGVEYIFIVPNSPYGTGAFDQVFRKRFVTVTFS